MKHFQSPIYAIKDRVSGQSTPVFIESNDLSARRQFTHFLKGSQNDPQDYELWYLGIYDTDVMRVLDSETSRLVLTGADVRWSLEVKEDTYHGE